MTKARPSFLEQTRGEDITNATRRVFGARPDSKPRTAATAPFQRNYANGVNPSNTAASGYTNDARDGLAADSDLEYDSEYYGGVEPAGNDQLEDTERPSIPTRQAAPAAGDSVAASVAAGVTMDLEASLEEDFLAPSDPPPVHTDTEDRGGFRTAGTPRTHDFGPDGSIATPARHNSHGRRPPVGSPMRGRSSAPDVSLHVPRL